MIATSRPKAFLQVGSETWVDIARVDGVWWSKSHGVPVVLLRGHGEVPCPAYRPAYVNQEAEAVKKVMDAIYELAKRWVPGGLA